jgi:dTDP-4-amino-4,6-dideoxygalactose transaminase
MWKVPLFALNYDDRELKAATDVIQSEWITMGEKTREFEDAFSEFLGNGSFCAAVANGTASLYMALLAAGVGSGDEVVIPSLTFVADLNVVRFVGATPVLVDCKSYDDWNISPAGIAAAITDRTKAVLIVHYAGYACDMNAVISAIKESAKGRHIPLIEDAAHAPGADYHGRKCGTIGDIGSFSFFSNKNLSIGEGGMVTTLSEEMNVKIRNLRSHGMTSLTFDRHKGQTISYDVVEPGLNFRMDEIRAAIGLVQLQKLSQANMHRGELVHCYFDLLEEENRIHMPFRHYDMGTPSYHIFPILLDQSLDRRAVIDGLKDRGIQSSIHYPAFQKFTAYRDSGLGETPMASDISYRELTLPLFSTMTLEQVEYVCDTLKKIVAGIN